MLPRIRLLRNRLRGPFAAPLLLLLAISLAQAAMLLLGGRVHSNDFKHLWLGSRVLALGGNPYDAETLLRGARSYGLGAINPYVYLPATGWMLRPLSALPFGVAATAWFAINGALAWACVLAGPLALFGGSRARDSFAGRSVVSDADAETLPPDVVDSIAMARLAGAAFLVGSLPFLRQMTSGQMNVTLVAAVLLSLLALRRGRDATAGAILGVAAAWKIAPLFLIATLFGMRRARAGVAGVATFAAICAAAEFLSGAGAHRAALPTLASMGYGESTWSEFGMDFHRDPFNQSFNSLAHHLVTENPHARAWMNLGPTAGPAVANGATTLFALVTLAVFGATLLRTRRRPYASPRWGEIETTVFLLATLAMLLLPSLMWDHYAVQTLPAIALVFGSRRTRTRPARAFAAFAVLAALAWPIAHPAWREGAGVLVMSLRLWGTLGLAALLGAELRDAMRARLEEVAAA